MDVTGRGLVGLNTEHFLMADPPRGQLLPADEAVATLRVGQAPDICNINAGLLKEWRETVSHPWVACCCVGRMTVWHYSSWLEEGDGCRCLEEEGDQHDRNNHRGMLPRVPGSCLLAHLLQGLVLTHVTEHSEVVHQRWWRPYAPPPLAVWAEGPGGAPGGSAPHTGLHSHHPAQALQQTHVSDSELLLIIFDGR